MNVLLRIASISACLAISLSPVSKLYAQRGNAVVTKTGKQSSIKYNPISKGDEVPPELEFTNLLNYDKPILRFSDFTGKLIILDFWAISCASCIKNFPKLETLQQQFKDRVQIILVNTKKTKDTREKITASFKRQEKVNGIKIKLPCIIENKTLEDLFTYQMVPHYVWIDQNGNVSQITEADQVTAQNIQSVIDNNKFSIPEKKDILKLDFGKPLNLNNDTADDKNIKYRSLLTGYSEGFPGATGIMCKNDSCWKIFATNVSILMLFQLAYPEAYAYPQSKIILDVKDPNKITYNPNDANWKYSNAFCYEFIMPKTTRRNIYALMQDDLQRYFNLKAGRESKKMKCFILKTNPNVNKSLTKGGERGSNLEENSRLGKFINNLPISILVSYMNNYDSIPVIDETNLKQNIDIKLPNDLRDISALKTKLKQQGFDLVEEVREIDVFVISEERSETGKLL